MAQTLRDVLTLYVGRQVNLRASSASQIAYSLSVLEKHTGGPVMLRRCEGRDGTVFLCAWIQARLKAGTSRKTVKGDRGNIVTLLRFAKEERLISLVPKVPTIRVEHKNPTAWTLEEVGALLHTGTKLEGWMRDLPIRRSWWYPSFMLFLYDSSLRVASSLTLRTEDVWLKRRTARIRASTDKGWSDQVVCLSDALVEMLREGMEGRELVFPYPWHHRQIWRDLAAIRDAAGLPSGRDHGFHKFRRTHATQAVIACGWEAARRSLGHSSETMTRSYVDMTQVQAAVRLELPTPKMTG